MYNFDQIVSFVKIPVALLEQLNFYNKHGLPVFTGSGGPVLTCTSTTWMESQHPLIFLEPSPAFLMRMTPANPWSRSHRYTEETPPSKYLRERERHRERVSQAPGQSERGGACTHRSLYWSKALLASTSSLRRRAEGMAPSSIGGSYLLLQGDLRETSNQQTIFPSNYVFIVFILSGFRS